MKTNEEMRAAIRAAGWVGHMRELLDAIIDRLPPPGQLDRLAERIDVMNEIEISSRNQDVKMLHGRIAALEARLPPAQPAPCPCTLVEQDPSCPVGYPSLLCEVCDGKGILPPLAQTNTPRAGETPEQDRQRTERKPAADPAPEPDFQNIIVNLMKMVKGDKPWSNMEDELRRLYQQGVAAGRAAR